MLQLASVDVLGSSSPVPQLNTANLKKIYSVN